VTGWQGLALVAKREVRERGRSKAFLISLALTVLVVVGAFVVPQLLGGGPATHRIGGVGDGNEPLVSAARELAAAGLDEDEQPDSFLITPYSTLPEARAALEAEEVDLVLVNGEEVILKSSGFFSQGGPVGLLQRAAGSVRLQQLVAENGQAVADVVAILASEPLQVSTLSGEDLEGDLRPLVAYVGLILMYIAILGYGTWTLTGVTEEKNNRVVEVLLATLRPWQLLGGKVLGIGILGLGQFLLTLMVAFIAVRITGLVELPALPITTVVVLLIWFVLGFGVYSVGFGAAGALASRPEEAQAVSFPLSTVAVVGFFVSFQVLDDPLSPAARIASFFPFTAPYVVPIRNSLDGIAWWEHALAIVVMVASIGLMVRVAGRVYRGGVLRSGGRVKIRDAWRQGDL
jgi:ABC-2 type transport system permease protein